MLYLCVIQITVVFILVKVSSQPISVKECVNTTQQSLFQYLNVSAFTDPNRYLRLNLSWDQPLGNFDTINIIIDNIDACTPLYGAEAFPIERHYFIKPTMEIVHPADPIIHGCQYDFRIESKIPDSNNSVCTMSQTINYIVPDCVNGVCKCKDEFSYSPYKLVQLDSISDRIYEISLVKTNDYFNDYNLQSAFHELFYESSDNKNAITYIHSDKLKFENNDSKIIVSLDDLQKGGTYLFGAKFVLDSCLYYSSMEVTVPDKALKRILMITGITLLIVITVLVSICSMNVNIKIVSKIRRYLRLDPLQSNNTVVTYSSQPISISPVTSTRVIKEEINAQYTPLEFILQSHKFDKYELPRNKVVCLEELGSGAFGRVCEAKIYDLDGGQGFKLAAVKQMLDNAPAEETKDFFAEIDLLKRIDLKGGHRNVIQILGCVTIGTPYLMVMELAPCGSLKKYLCKLRMEWEKKKKHRKTEVENKLKNMQRFFPDDMEESWLNPLLPESAVETSNGMKYTDVENNNAVEEPCLQPNPSDSSGSYILPDSPSSPTTPKSPTPLWSPRSPNPLSAPRSPTSLVLKKPPIKPIGRCLRRLSSTHQNQPLASPSSVTSSRLPSITETLMTNITDSESPTNHEDLVAPALNHIELQEFASQIARGMAFLESINLAHRDLAARNILIANDKTLKISDFGMARTTNYVPRKSKKMPLRWMAPEAIEGAKCDNKSDVWSFGVVLWEIGSLGGFPYDKIPNSLILHNLKKGIRLEPPEVCTEELYSLMERCWSTDPAKRPHFSELVQILDVNKQKVYVDFNQISPNYVFPPVKDSSSSSKSDSNST